MKSTRRTALAAILSLGWLCMVPSLATAAELRVEPLAEPAPSEGLSGEVASALATGGLKVLSGTSRTLCHLWLVKDAPLVEGFKPTSTVLYPFTPGQLLGVVEFRRKGGDFRGQEIEKGLYTLRYAQQPEDGNHVGTSDTRDFIVLIKAEDDKAPAVLPKESLFRLSAAAAGTTHPCMLSFLAPAKDAKPSIENDAEKEWAILQCGIGAKAGPVPVRLVIEGKSAE